MYVHRKGPFRQQWQREGGIPKRDLCLVNERRVSWIARVAMVLFVVVEKGAFVNDQHWACTWGITLTVSGVGPDRRTHGFLLEPCQTGGRYSNLYRSAMMLLPFSKVTIALTSDTIWSHLLHLSTTPDDSSSDKSMSISLPPLHPGAPAKVTTPSVWEFVSNFPTLKWHSCQWCEDE